MKSSELKLVKDLSIGDLSIRIAKTRKVLADLVIDQRQSTATKGSADVKVIFKNRKDLAQMLTVLRQKQLIEELKEAQDGR